MGYVVFGKAVKDGVTYYAVSDGSAEPETITEKELSFLVDIGIKDMQDIMGKPVTLQGGVLHCNCTDITEQLEAEEESEDDSFWVDEEEDEDSEEEGEIWGDEYSDEDDEEEDGEEEEEEYIIEEEDDEEEEEEDEDFWTGESDAIDDFYRDWYEHGQGVVGYGTPMVVKTDTQTVTIEQEESTESKLYSYLSEEQINALQEYYLYISERIFKLERGVSDLPVKRKADLSAIRNTGHTWVYAGFVDMGYAGTSKCPHCGARLRNTALSACHHAPVVKIRAASRSKKKVNDERAGTVERTFNGVCSAPNCRAHCSVVTDTVGVRKIDRSRQVGIICEKCGNEVPQSSHYCTFNDPVRYMHIAWDTYSADLDQNFYGQFANEKIEALINSANTIKFGLECTAEFFDIAKDSNAFAALKDVQEVCKKDMALLEEEYAQGETHCQEIMNSFTILDSYIDKLTVFASKRLMLAGDDRLASRLFTVYKKLRKLGVVPPKSLIQYIRDFLVDWQTHKFVDSPNAGVLGSVGTLYGARSNDRNACKERFAYTLDGLYGKRAKVFADSIIAEDFDYVTDLMAIYNAFVDMFIYRICGYYAYDGVKWGDEGGKDRDKDGNGTHALALKAFRRGYAMRMPKDFTFDHDYFGKLLDCFALLKEAEKYRKFQFIHGFVRGGEIVEVESRTDNNYDRCLWEDSHPYARYKDGVLKEAVKSLSRYNNRLRGTTIDEAYNKLSELVALFQQAEQEYPEYERQVLEQETRGTAPEIECKTPREVLDWLFAQTFDDKISKESDLERQILETLRRSGKEPTPKQFKYIVRFFERISGSTYKGEELEEKGIENPDEMLKAVDYIVANRPSGVPAHTLAICETIAKSRKISPRQAWALKDIKNYIV